MATFTSGFGWTVTGTVEQFDVDSNGNLVVRVMSAGGVLVSFLAADVTVQVS
jgi:hypothetical protein